MLFMESLLERKGFKVPGIELGVAVLSARLRRRNSRGMALTLAEWRVGVNTLRLTRRAHVVHELNRLFISKYENISRGKTGADGY